MGFGWRTYRPRIRSYPDWKKGDTVAVKPSYTVGDLALLWQISERTLRRMIQEGKLKAFKAGATWRVNEAERLRLENSWSTADKSDSGE